MQAGIFRPNAGGRRPPTFPPEIPSVAAGPATENFVGTMASGIFLMENPVRPMENFVRPMENSVRTMSSGIFLMENSVGTMENEISATKKPF